MAFSINSFRANLRNGGLRRNLFEVILTNPVVSSGDGILPFRCSAASLPENVITEKQVMYFGRPIKLPGNRLIQQWQTTIIEDEDFVVRDALEAWQSTINAWEGNINRFPTSEQALYKTLANIKMFAQNGPVIREIQLDGIWPQAIGAIELGWESDDIATYSVTWSYDFMRPISADSDVEV